MHGTHQDYRASCLEHFWFHQIDNEKSYKSYKYGSTIYYNVDHKNALLWLLLLLFSFIVSIINFVKNYFEWTWDSCQMYKFSIWILWHNESMCISRRYAMYEYLKIVRWEYRSYCDAIEDENCISQFPNIDTLCLLTINLLHSSLLTGHPNCHSRMAVKLLTHLK